MSEEGEALAGQVNKLVLDHLYAMHVPEDLIHQLEEKVGAGQQEAPSRSRLAELVARYDAANTCVDAESCAAGGLENDGSDDGKGRDIDLWDSVANRAAAYCGAPEGSWRLVGGATLREERSARRSFPRKKTREDFPDDAAEEQLGGGCAGVGGDPDDCGLAASACALGADGAGKQPTPKAPPSGNAHYESLSQVINARCEPERGGNSGRARIHIWSSLPWVCGCGACHRISHAPRPVSPICSEMDESDIGGGRTPSLHHESSLSPFFLFRPRAGGSSTCCSASLACCGLLRWVGADCSSCCVLRSARLERQARRAPDEPPRPEERPASRKGSELSQGSSQGAEANASGTSVGEASQSRPSLPLLTIRGSKAGAAAGPATRASAARCVSDSGGPAHSGARPRRAPTRGASLQRRGIR